MKKLIKKQNQNVKKTIYGYEVGVQHAYGFACILGEFCIPVRYNCCYDYDWSGCWGHPGTCVE